MQNLLPEYSVCKVVSLVNTFPQAFLEVLLHSLHHVGRKCCHFFRDVLFQIHRCPWFLFVHLALEISSQEEVLRLGTLVPMNIEVPTKYPLSHNDRIIVFEIHLHIKSPMLYRPALHGKWSALSLARRALKDKFPTPTVPLTTVLPNRQVFLPDPVYLGHSVCALYQCMILMLQYWTCFYLEHKRTALNWSPNYGYITHLCIHFYSLGAAVKCDRGYGGR